jgi:hypothetical protein
MGINSKIQEILADQKSIFVNCEKCLIRQIYTGTKIEVRRFKNNWDFVHSHLEDGGDRMSFQRYNKAIVAVVAGAVLLALEKFGITPDMPVKDVIELLVLGGLVYFVPNKR